jgi:hypothetical protein
MKGAEIFIGLAAASPLTSLATKPSNQASGHIRGGAHKMEIGRKCALTPLGGRRLPLGHDACAHRPLSQSSC